MNGMSVSMVSQLSSREEWQKRNAVFRVSFAYSVKDCILELSLWPSDIEICYWYFKSTTKVDATKGLLMLKTLPILTMDSLTSMLHSKNFNICSFNMYRFFTVYQW